MQMKTRFGNEFQIMVSRFLIIDSSNDKTSCSKCKKSSKLCIFAENLKNHLPKNKVQRK